MTIMHKEMLCWLRGYFYNMLEGIYLKKQDDLKLPLALLSIPKEMGDGSAVQNILRLEIFTYKDTLDLILEKSSSLEKKNGENNIYLSQGAAFLSEVKLRQINHNIWQIDLCFFTNYLRKQNATSES